MYSDLYSLLGIPTINSERKYWIIRSESGIYYDDFAVNDYIAIAWDYLSMRILEQNKAEDIRVIIEDEEVPESTDSSDQARKTKITTIYNKVNNFINEMSEGDIVLVPGTNSQKVSFGQICSPPYEKENYAEIFLKENPDSEIIPCPYKKRRKVKWLKAFDRTNMDIYLYKAFSSHHALSDMKEYAGYIDRALNPIYLKNDELHCTLHAGHPNGMSLRTTTRFFAAIQDALFDIAAQLEDEISDDSVQLKINVHSPGIIEIIGYTAGAGISISILTAAVNQLLNGGKFKIGFKRDVSGNLEFTLESESEGFAGRKLEDKKLTLKNEAELLSICKDIDVKSETFPCETTSGNSEGENLDN